MGRVMTLYLTAGEPTLGLWCDHCALPSGFEVPMLALTERGVSTVAWWRRCHDCDRPLSAEAH